MPIKWRKQYFTFLWLEAETKFKLEIIPSEEGFALEMNAPRWR